jgi:hypothetical protein
VGDSTVSGMVIREEFWETGREGESGLARMYARFKSRSLLRSVFSLLMASFRRRGSFFRQAEMMEFRWVLGV